MTITITAFDRSPDGGRGLARDTRVRWALEEVDQRDEVRLAAYVARGESRPAYRRAFAATIAPERRRLGELD
jgi:glutathione S-transferase